MKELIEQVNKEFTKAMLEGNYTLVKAEESASIGYVTVQVKIDDEKFSFSCNKKGFICYHDSFMKTTDKEAEATICAGVWAAYRAIEREKLEGKIKELQTKLEELEGDETK